MPLLLLFIMDYFPLEAHPKVAYYSQWFFLLLKDHHAFYLFIVMVTLNLWYACKSNPFLLLLITPMSSHSLTMFFLTLEVNQTKELCFTPSS